MEVLLDEIHRLGALFCRGRILESLPWSDEAKGDRLAELCVVVQACSGVLHVYGARSKVLKDLGPPGILVSDYKVLV